MNTTRRHLVLLPAALAAATLAGRPAFAQTGYPEKMVKVIVPYSPGSNPDLAARIAMQALSERLGQSFVPETRIGAGGAIGLAAAAKAAPDGYTLVVGHVGGMAINPAIYEKLPYDPLKDFAPITQIYKSPLLLLVAENSPYKSVADIIAAAKAQPGALTFSSGGNGNGAHLSGESMAVLSGVSMRHIPYKSVSDALVAVISGDATFSFGNISLGMPLVKGKKLRAIAFSGDARIAEYPEIPLVGDTVKGFEFNDWTGLLAPAGTPAPIIARLQKEMAALA
ncbi:MAG TPA: tripartite tricarboxylate transporter substrate-binding protein, partial [Ramlibacter sp.]|nr:tripartite tricarboxylate transporter substrate-binding protein [Ramlibacter sp.]